MEILYCDRCGIRVPEKDLEDGRAVRNETSVVCAQCHKIKTVKPAGASRSSGAHLLPGASKTEKRSEVAVKPAQKAAGTPGGTAAMHRPSTITRAENPKSAQATILVIVGVLVLGVGGLLALRSGEKPTASVSPKPEASSLSTPGLSPKLSLPTPSPAAAKTVTDPAAQPPTPPDAEISPEEKEAQAAYEILLQFEGLAPEDRAGRLQRIEAFVAKYGGTLQAARARVLADEYRTPKPPTPVVEVPLTPNADVKYGASPPFSMTGCRFVWFPEDGFPAATRYFRRVFELPTGDGIKAASMLITCDDQFVLYVNGSKVAFSGTDIAGWRGFQWVDFTAALRPGKNLLAATGTNTGGPAALVGRLQVELAGGAIQTIDTDVSWKSANVEQEGWTKDAFDDKDWVAAKDVGAFEVGWANTTFPDHFTFVAKGPPPVRFLKLDAATKGGWKGTFGADGYTLSAFNAPAAGKLPARTHDLEKLPEYVAELKKEGAESYVGTADAALSLVSPDDGRRVWACDFSESSFTYLVKLKASRAFRLAVYCVDMNNGRKQRIEILDAEKETVLDTQELERFAGGVYPVWEIRAPAIRIRFVHEGGLNAVCSGVFFDPLPGEAAAVAGGAKTPATGAGEPDPLKPVDPKTASSDTVLAEAERYVKSSRWKEALERIECLISSPPEGRFTAEQQAKIDSLRAKARGELANAYLRGDRVKLAGAKRQLPDGRWEFLYDFRSPAQKMDFHAPPNKLDALDKGELLLTNIDVPHMLEFTDDLEVFYEVATAGGPANRVHLGYYDVRGEFGAEDNKWTGVWRDGPEGWRNPLSRNDAVTLVPGKWHRVEIQFEKKTKATTINIDGKQSLKFSDPAAAGKGIVYLGCAFGAKFRNLGIRGSPTLESLERAEQQQKFALEFSRKFAAGQPVPILNKNDEPFWLGGSWKMTGDEAGGANFLWIPSVASPNYELNLECRRIEGREFQIYFRTDAIHSWHINFFDGGVHARIWDHAQGALAKVVKALVCDSTAWHKIQVLSRGKTLRVVMDEKEVLFDLKDVPLDAWGPFWVSWDAKCAVRKATIRYVP